MIDRRLVLVVLICLSCKPAAPSKPAAATATAPAGPQLRATVVTIETKLVAPDRTLRHTITIANDRARSSDELDRWRLFDLKNNRVTFVDDLERTYRTVDAKQLAADRTSALADDDEVPVGFPRAEVVRGTTPRAVLGVNASELVVKLGAYERHLWIAEHNAIPPQLFAMMQASEPLATPLAPVMRAAEEALLSVRGFPLEDHAELPYGDRKMVVDRKVVSITQANVPAALFDVNRAFRHLAAPPAAAPKPRSTKPRPVVEETTQPVATETTTTTAPVAPVKVAPAKAKQPVVKKAPPKKKTVVKKAAVKKAPAKKAPPKKKTPVPKQAPAKKVAGGAPATTLAFVRAQRRVFTYSMSALRSASVKSRFAVPSRICV
ncbi:MAG: hypothetical protein QOI24_680 [Acidobacteriota bacterium]|nr:hypothetical protein [Acidobacteriota bacterium]